VVALDEAHHRGSAHLYLGVLKTLVPAEMGGRPETGRGHFERAFEFSEGQNLMIKVVFAEHYARLVFDQNLRDRLLNEAIEADAKQDSFALINTLAQKKARVLLDASADYFKIVERDQITRMFKFTVSFYRLRNRPGL